MSTTIILILLHLTDNEFSKWSYNLIRSHEIKRLHIFMYNRINPDVIDEFRVIITICYTDYPGKYLPVILHQALSLLEYMSKLPPFIDLRSLYVDLINI